MDEKRFETARNGNKKSPNYLIWRILCFFEPKNVIPLGFEPRTLTLKV